MKKNLLMLLILTAATLALSGCFRKHIESSPPAKTPSHTMGSGSEPGLIEETHEVGTSSAPLDKPIEEVYEVDAPQNAEPVAVGEKELAEEPLPEAGQLQREAEAAAAETATEPAMIESAPETGQVAETPDAPEADTPENTTVSGQYYVQVGAFSDLENANRVLARLIADGYKDSVLIRTDGGLFRVQAGSFPDESSAEDALTSLVVDYPKGFVLKKP
ncbi:MULTISPECIES: SPOR domain-containing protein [unclassified Pseudodesulfovibrio]|uniref:SPOR domain-containing protein n=1 Tax=unclassified Pseudodesulfovibrio TaxID=2661612 RepID=UPI000FEBC67B|nr:MULTISPECIES: SPOR domain-containing protein [unclassified Pseudodesulfovibrio]MCJ2165737.1 SPOR domain-containing protein [Pseudodesulfovibrio sp. S3-i]RWU02892.1 SPOR domain-containing protein [Pseudodesulfovibrio sp. S3]